VWEDACHEGEKHGLIEPPQDSGKK